MSGAGGSSLKERASERRPHGAPLTSRAVAYCPERGRLERHSVGARDETLFGIDGSERVLSDKRFCFLNQFDFGHHYEARFVSQVTTRHIRTLINLCL